MRDFSLRLASKSVEMWLFLLFVTVAIKIRWSYAADSSGPHGLDGIGESLPMLEMPANESGPESPTPDYPDGFDRKNPAFAIPGQIVAQLRPWGHPNFSKIKFHLLPFEDDNKSHADQYAQARAQMKANVGHFDNDKKLTEKTKTLLRKIDKNRGLRFVVHGWTDSLNSLQKFKIGDVEWPWPVVISQDWRRHEQMDVIFLHYAAHAARNYHFRSSRKLRGEVAEALSIIVEGVAETLFENDIKAQKDFIETQIRLAGHSLGAEVIGDAAEWVERKFGVVFAVIYALDAPALKFEEDIDQRPDKFSHLGPQHANLVFGVHSSKTGTDYAIGHIDFYFRGGGSGIQPGNEIFMPSSVHHQRVLWLFRIALKHFEMNGDRVTLDQLDYLIAGFKYESNADLLMSLPEKKFTLLDKLRDRTPDYESYPAMMLQRNQHTIFTIWYHNILHHEKNYGIYYVPSTHKHPFVTMENKYNAAMPMLCAIKIVESRPGHGTIPSIIDFRHIFGTDLVQPTQMPTYTANQSGEEANASPLAVPLEVVATA